MGCAFSAAAPASHATHYRINALVKHSRQPLRRRPVPVAGTADLGQDDEVVAVHDLVGDVGG